MLLDVVAFLGTETTVTVHSDTTSHTFSVTNFDPQYETELLTIIFANIFP
jgi:hypothetical protein